MKNNDPIKVDFKRRRREPPWVSRHQEYQDSLKLEITRTLIFNTIVVLIFIGFVGIMYIGVK